jgi:hypothetical protein
LALAQGEKGDPEGDASTSEAIKVDEKSTPTSAAANANNTGGVGKGAYENAGPVTAGGVVAVSA